MTKAQRWGFFAVVSLGLLMIGLDNSILYTALPALEHSLDASPEPVSYTHLTLPTKA